MSNYTTQQKIALFRSFFGGLKNVYGTYDLKTNKVRQIKAPVTDEVLLAHLKGLQPYGVYLLTGHQTKALAVDFDKNNLSWPVEFVVAARDHHLPVYIERSKSKGYHGWMFFQEPLSARKARLAAQKILSDIGLAQTEIFPKQDRLDSNVNYGNFINAPLFGKLVVQDRTVFLDPDDPTTVCPDQWDFLQNIKRIELQQLNAVIKTYQLDTPNLKNDQSPPENPSDAATYEETSFGLPPCARQMLAEGVAANQRVCVFRLAVHLRKIGLPLDLAILTLTAWSQKNRPVNGKDIITEAEVRSQTNYAYQKQYRGFGCEDAAINRYCDPKCFLHRSQ